MQHHPQQQSFTSIVTRIALVLLCCAFFFFGGAESALAAQSQTRTASLTNCADDASIGTVAWGNAKNASTTDDVYATSSLDGTISHYIKCTNYGFTLPTGAQIVGVVVNVERKSDSTGNGGSTDAAIRLVKGGTIGGSSKNTGTTYTTGDVIEAHGTSTTDLWGNTLTDTDVNATTFGAAFAATKPSSAGAAHIVSVDQIEIVVYYNPVFTVSGTLYSNDGITADTAGSRTIKLRVGSSTPSIYSTTTLSGTGVFQFQNLAGIDAGNPLSLWVDNDSSFRAFTFTKASSSVNNITGVDLYKNNVIVKHEGTSGTSTSNTDLGYYDGDDDTDIQYTANSGALAVSAGEALLIATSTTFLPGGTVTLYGNASTTIHDGDIRLGQSSVFTMGGDVTLAGSWYASTSSALNPSGYTVYMNASTTGKVLLGELTGDSAFGNLTFSGTTIGGWTFTDNASTSAFGIVAIGWGSATDTANTHIRTLAFDSTHGVMYAGSGDSGGHIYRCDTTTSCDSSTDWTVATDTPLTSIYSLTFDATHGVMYAGGYTSGGAGTIYRCDTTTSCDSSGDWTTATSTSADYIYSLGFDSTHSVLYAGGGITGRIFRCDTTTGGACATGSDWTTSTDTPASSIYSFTFDSTHGVMYAGTDDGRIFRCDTTTLCDSNLDWTTSTNALSEVRSLAFDATHGVVYAGSGFSGTIYRCDTTSLCDAAGDWTTSYDTPDSSIYSLSFASTSGVMYAGGYSGGTIYSCNTATLCDSSGDWTQATDTTETYPDSLAFDSTNGVMYMGTGLGGKIYRNEMTLTGGTVVAPSQLTIAGDYENDGTFTANGGTVYIAGSSTLSGTMTGVSAFNNVTLVSPDWTTSYDTPESSISSLALDSTHGVMYAGSYSNGIIYRCDTTTLCDSAGDWTTATDTSAGFIHSLAFDSTHGVMYAGSDISGLIFRCDTTTLCDSSTDWTVATDTPASDIRSLSFDSTNGVMYAGSGNSGIIYRCDTTTLCDSLSDWTTATDTAEAAIYSLVFDPTHGLMYAGSDGGNIYRCDTTTLCDSLSDWTTSYDMTESFIYSLAFDSTNDVMYAGSGSGSGKIYRCDTTTLCDASGDWTTATDTAAQYIESLAFDSTSGIMYAGTGFSNGIILRCDTTTLCDSAGDWTVATDTSDVDIKSLAFDSGNGVIYAGIGSSIGLILRYEGKNAQAVANATATDITINIGTTLTAPSLLTIRGNFTQNGVFTANSGTVYFGGTTLQTATGTMTWNSSFYNLTITNTAATTSFPAPFTVTNNFTASSSGSRIQFAAGATTTIYNFIVTGSSGNEVYLYSSTTGTQWKLSAGTTITGWAVATDTANTHIRALAFDSTHGVMYAGGGDSGGHIYRCDTTTACDSLTDWTSSTDTPATSIYSLAFDATHGVMYAGGYTSGNGGNIYRCDTTTSCDSSADWTAATSTSDYVYSLGFDSTHGVIYAGSGLSGYIYRCDTTTGGACASGSDWTRATSTQEYQIWSFAFDSTHGIMYAGAGTNAGRIFRCDTSTLCDSNLDWTTSINGLTEVKSLAFDATHGVIYAGTQNSGIIYRCDTTSLCDAAGDWTTAYDTPETEIYSLAFASTSGVMYAGGYNSGIIYRCDTTTLCDAAGDWTIATNTPEIYPNTLGFDSTNGVMYMGTGLVGKIYRNEITLPGGTSTVSYANVKDSYACNGVGNITASNSTDSSNNNCWNISAPAGGPNQNLLHYRFREDNGSESNAVFLSNQDTPLTSTSSVYKGDRKRLRMMISNTGTADATGITYQLEYASSSCTFWTAVPSYNQQTWQEWTMDLSPWIGGGVASTNFTGSLTDPGGYSFVPGYLNTNQNQTPSITLTNTQFTELEYSLRSTLQAQQLTTYCFRLTNAGSTTNFSYTVTPTLVITNQPRREAGGANSEANGQGTSHGGGTQGGGSGSEGNGSGTTHGGGGQGGGGGDSG